MASKLTLTFTAVGVIDESIDITGTGKILTFKGTRLTSKQVTKGATIDVQITEFFNSLELDYNRELIYTITIVGVTIEIEHFDNTHFDSFVDGTHNLTATITTAKSTTSQRIVLSASAVFTEASADKCNKASCVITFSTTVNELQVFQVQGGVNVYHINDTEFNGTVTPSFDAFRTGWSLDIIMTVDGQPVNTESIFPPNTLELTSLVISENAYGGAVTINTKVFLGSDENLFAIVESTSIVAPDYQSSPYFTSLVEGSYIAYVKDKYGCVRTEPFTINIESSTNYSLPYYFFLSGKNSVRFVNRILPSGALSANNFNFFIGEMPELIADQNFTQIYSKGQNPEIQFKSSYPRHRIRVFTEGTGASGTQTQAEISLSQKTTNLNRIVFLEGITTWSTEFEMLMISFKPGNIYNSSGVVIGSHVFDDYLPAYYQIGVAIKINGVASIIVDIITTLGIIYAVTNISDNNPEASTIIESVHTALPYEVFQFTLDMDFISSMFNALVPELDVKIQKFYITIEAFKAGASRSENEVPDEYYCSDRIQVITDVELSASKRHIIEAWNKISDSEIDYTDWPTLVGAKLTGIGIIRHLKNIEFITTMKRISSAEIDTEKLDNKLTKIDYKTIKVYELKLRPIPSEYAGQVMDTFNECEFFLIDGLFCTTIEEAGITEVGQLSKVSVKVGVIGLANELGVLSFNQGEGQITGEGFYPVVVT